MEIPTSKSMGYRSFGVDKGTTLYKRCLAFVMALTVLQIILVGWGIKEYPELRQLFFGEDWTYEYLTAIFYIAAGGMLLYTFFKFPLSKRYKLFVLAFAILFLFVAMEEISWGQRIFGIETPETIAEINEQDELNIHNLHTDLFHVLLWAGSLSLGVILPLLHETLEPIRRLVKFFEFPVMSPDLSFFFLLPVTYYMGHRWVEPKLVIFIISTVGLFVFLHLPQAESYVKKLPPVWGKYLILIIPILAIVMFQVHRYLIPLTDNKAGQEASEMVLSFGYLIFAWAVMKKVELFSEKNP